MQYVKTKQSTSYSLLNMAHYKNLTVKFDFNTEKISPWDMMPLSWQKGSRHMSDMKRGDMVQLTLIMLQTKY